jgi:TolB protein
MKKIFLSLLAVVFFILPCYAHDIYLSISATGKRSDIALEYFVPEGKNENTLKFAKLLREIIENDIILSRYFNVIQAAPVAPKNSAPVNLKERLLFWQKKGALALLTGNVANDGDNLILEAKMLEVVTGKTIWSHKYKNKSLNYRYLAHQASDEIVKRFVGEIGIARSKIVFVNDSTGHKEVYIIDYDGHNLRRLTKDNKINVLPKWSMQGDKIIYTNYLYNNPDLFVLNLVNSRRSIISKHQGLNAAGMFAPDGKKILLTLSKGGYPNLYLIDTSGKILKTMTDGSHIDTSPSFAPNGQEIVFISDRCGYPQLYIMNIDGGNVRRLATSGFCDSPAWSPRGDKIVFTMRKAGGSYDLYVYDLYTARIIRLTNNQRNNENPTWSPDGRFVVFYSNRSGKGEIYIMAIDGSGTRKLTQIPGTSYTPSWSPILTD